MNYAETRILVYSKSKDEFRPVKIYRDSEGRKWIEAKHNSEFRIEIDPMNYSTYLAVVSVDGLNVITGKEAEEKPENGYILSPFQKLKINGWRTSLSEVRKFVFTCNRKETYSSKLNNDTTNNGVIGVCLFSEKLKPSACFNVYSGISSLGNINIFGNPIGTRGFDSGSKLNDPWITCSCNASEPTYKDMSMGTKQGEVSYDAVTEVEKEFNDWACFTDVIYYDSRENLIRNGIIKESEELPRPFKNSRFCPSL